MQVLQTVIPLREYCRKYQWPRLPQWHHWIYAKNPIAKTCVKKVGGRYLVDLNAFHKYVEAASLEEKLSESESANTELNDKLEAANEELTKTKAGF